MCEFHVQTSSVYYSEIVVAKYHGQVPVTAIIFYGHAFGSVLCKVRAKACVICSFDSVSAVASVNLTFKPLQKKIIRLLSIVQFSTTSSIGSERD
jgi:hypothetical protein